MNCILTLAAALFLAALPLRTHVDDAQSKPERDYVAPLFPLNDSGVEGTAELELEGDQLRVKIEAAGLEASKIHPQHIHGHEHKNASCPPDNADTNGDGVIDIGEGLPYYGPVIVPLTPFPTADAEGRISFDEVFTVDPGALGPLQKRAVVLHGMTVNGEYVASLPVACGEIRVKPPAASTNSARPATDDPPRPVTPRPAAEGGDCPGQAKD